MTLNSAELLVQYFEASIDDRRKYTLGALWSAIEDVESHINLWAGQGKNVAPFERSKKSWRKEVLAGLDTDSGRVSSYGTKDHIADGDIGVLEWVATLLHDEVPASSPEHREQIRKMVQDVRALVRDDDSLPERLRMHLVHLLLHVESVLDTYELMGDSALEDAVERLIGAVKLAEASSKKPGKWGTFWDKWVVPISVGMLSGSPGTVLSAVQMLEG